MSLVLSHACVPVLTHLDIGEGASEGVSMITLPFACWGRGVCQILLIRVDKNKLKSRCVCVTAVICGPDLRQRAFEHLHRYPVSVQTLLLQTSRKLVLTSTVTALPRECFALFCCFCNDQYLCHCSSSRTGATQM